MSLSSTENREIRKFGIVAVLVFGLLFLVGVWKGRVIITWVFGLLSLGGLAFLCFPGPLKPAFHLWMKFAHVLGVVSTAFILTVAYYLVITPTALLKRLFGGRPLPLRPDPKASSYWVERSEPAQAKERFIKRY